MGRMELHPTDWLTSNTHFDLYSKRGIGLGQDFEWETPNGGGGIEAYYINDRSPFQSTKSAADESLVNSTRYRVKIGHREQLTDNTYFITQINYLSDPFVTEDFFRDEFRRNANPENYAVVQHATDEYAASLRIDRRMNGFYTNMVDRIPELEFDWYRSQIKDSPFYVESESSLSFLEMNDAETNQLPFLRPDNYHSARFDTYNQLFLPLRFDNFFNVIPRTAYRGTWYSKTPNAGAVHRNIFEFGTLASFKMHKQLTDKSGFYGEGLNHIMQPYTEYSYRDNPSKDAVNLYQFDDIDTLESENLIYLGLRNFIQTKRGDKRIANVLDADVYTAYRFEHDDDENGFGLLGAKMNLSLTDHFSVHSDLEYDWHDGSFEDFNARAQLTTTDFSEYSVGYRYLDGVRSLYTAKALLFPNDDWSYEFTVRYDSDGSQWGDRELMVNRRFDCVGVGVGFQCDQDDDIALWLQLWLTAFDRDNKDMRP